MGVEDVIEDIVVVAADKPRIFEAAQEVDHAAGVHAAVDVVAGEDELALRGRAGRSAAPASPAGGSSHARRL